MDPLDPAPGPEESGSRPLSDIVPAQAMAQGGTFVRPGALAWGEAPGGAPDTAGEMVEKALAAMASGGHPNDLLDELARARVWIPLPEGPHPVTDGSAVTLPVVTYLGADFVPCFTSAERLAHYEGCPPRQAPGVPEIPHIVVPATALARRLPPGLGLALNPGAGASVPIYPEGVAHLAGDRAGRAGQADGPAGGHGGGVRVGHPPDEPDALLAEVARGLRHLPVVVTASRAWLSVPGAGEGLVLSVTLEDPASPAAHAAVVGTIERAVASVPRQPGYPIDVTFPGESAPDVIDVWVAEHTRPFYERAGARG